MFLQEAVFHDFSHQTLIEAGAVQVCRLFGLHQLGIHRFRGHHKAQAQPRRQYLGERAHIKDTFRIARSQG